MERRKIMLMLVILAILGILAALSTDRASLHTYEVTYEWVWEDGSHEVFVDTLLAPGRGSPSREGKEMDVRSRGRGRRVRSLPHSYDVQRNLRGLFKANHTSRGSRQVEAPGMAMQ